MSELPILIVDDEEHTRLGLATTIEQLGFGATTACAGLGEARAALAGQEFALVLLDLHLGDGSGEDLLAELSANRPELPVVVVTGSHELATAVRCLRARAIDYLVKPVDPAALEGALRRVLDRRELERENRALSPRGGGDAPSHPEAFAGLITLDPAMLRLMVYAEVVAPGRQAVLVTGETGTGKELMARAIHRLSRRSGRFVAVNAAGLDDEMLSDALFGHRRGAYTGAAGERAGLVAEAEDGTLFLDEIGDLSAAAQVKLLRLLQEGEYYPLGADRPLRSSARIVAATHRDLAAAVKGGGFRQDLYYRLHAHHLHLPPLRERTGDIPALVHHFAAEAAADLGLPVPPVGAQALREARARPWPGNVRELAAAVHEAVGRGGGGALAFSARNEAAAPPASEAAFPEVLPTLDEMRDRLVAEALRRTGGNLPEAARLLGISRWGLSKRLRQGGDGAQPGCAPQLR
ncbi:MAG: sigma-54 dependent transcriptional regulator [Planctomycetes bacterium]|nr:sigma-54 dependent transcriptional regulator [Planctomycetota bacterium]